MLYILLGIVSMFSPYTLLLLYATLRDILKANERFYSSVILSILSDTLLTIDAVGLMSKKGNE